MARYTVIWADGFISKDGVGYGDQDLSWLPDDILVVQVMNDGSADVEKGNRDTLTTTSNEEISDINAVDWGGNISTTWQAAYDAEAAWMAAQQAEKAAEEAESGA